MTTTNEIETRCIECKSKIYAGATKCISCGSYQYKLKNTIFYFAQVAGFITILVSLVLFIVNSWPEFRKNIFWNDSVKVISFDERRSLTLINSGDGKIFLESIEIITPVNGDGSNSSSIGINKEIESGNVLSHKFDIKSEQQSKYKAVGFVHGGNTPTTQRWVDIVNATINRRSNCYKLAIYDKNNPVYLQVVKHYEQIGSSPMTIPQEAILHIYSFRKAKRIMIPFDIVTMVLEYTGHECKA